MVWAERDLKAQPVSNPFHEQRHLPLNCIAPNPIQNVIHDHFVPQDVGNSAENQEHSSAQIQEDKSLFLYSPAA